MAHIATFEQRIQEAGYFLSQVIYNPGTFDIKDAFGIVNIVVPKTINGKKLKSVHSRKVRWDADGKCYAQRGDKRYREYDLKLD